MVVAVFRALEGESLEDFSIRLAERWRIGRRGLDDGVILLVFVEDRRLRLEVGYGLEPVLPDAVAGGIVGEVIVPRFREGRHAAGLEAAAAAVYRRIAEARGGARPAPRRDGPVWPVLGFAALMGLLMAFLAWEVASQRRRHRRRLYTLGPQGWYVPAGPTWRSGAGGWPGGLGGGGGFSGGGFSGGGGGFGGGGASGRW